MIQPLFSGRSALVTGAGGGIGRCIALALAREGAKVWLVGRREAELEETAHLIHDTGGEAQGLAANVTDERAMARVIERIGPLNMAVNAAGTIASGALHEMEEESFQRVLWSTPSACGCR